MKFRVLKNLITPGRYLLYNIPSEIEKNISAQGAITFREDNFQRLIQTIERNESDTLIIKINILEKKFITDILTSLKNSSIRKLILITTLEKEIKIHFDDFLNLAQKNLFIKDIKYELYNPIDPEHLTSLTETVILLTKLKKDDLCFLNPPRQFIKKINFGIEYIQTGDNVLILSDKLGIIKDVILQKTEATNVQILEDNNIEDILSSKEGFNFIISTHDEHNKKYNKNIIDRHLLPSARLMLIADDYFKINFEELKDHELAIEEFYIYNPSVSDYEKFTYDNQKNLENISLCILMKSPLSQTSHAYKENIYGYDCSPIKALAFSWNYINPWILRGVIEFKYRNRSPVQLREYCLKIINSYCPFSADYAASLCVLGYQIYEEKIQDNDLVEKTLNDIKKYIKDLPSKVDVLPHQIRWFISLSCLMGNIYNKANDKHTALYYYSRASQVDFRYFSPTIGTKILHSLLLQAKILISLDKKIYAEILIENGIKRGITLLNQPADELLGNKNRPVNFIMYIYHDILEYIIKLIDLKKSLQLNRLDIYPVRESFTWSYIIDNLNFQINQNSIMLNERYQAIIEMGNFIYDKEKQIQHLTEKLKNNHINFEDKTMKNKKIAWLIPNLIEGSGGHRTMLLHAAYLETKGYDCTIYLENQASYKSAQVVIFDTFGIRLKNVVYGWHNINPCDVAVATIWYSVSVVRKLTFPCKKIYFVQDYEAYFNSVGDAYLLAENSYRYGLTPITIGRWLSHKLMNDFNINSFYFDFGADKTVYRPLESYPKEKSICFIYQPDKPRRCSRIGIEALRIVKHVMPDVTIYLYGSSIKENLNFDYTHLGLLSPIECNELYNKCSVGFCISASNPSRIPFEMMSAGLPVIEVWRENNLYDFDDNTLLLCQQNPQSLAGGIIKLFNSPELLSKIASNALNFMTNRSIEQELEQFFYNFSKIINQEEHHITAINKSYKELPFEAEYPDSFTNEGVSTIQQSFSKKIFIRLPLSFQSVIRHIYYKIKN